MTPYAATLPWPPSVNRYWRHARGRTYIDKPGRDFRALVADLYGQTPQTGRLALCVWAFPPDRRKRDLDNVLKALLDALEHASWYADDEQIDVLAVTRGEVRPGDGAVDVLLTITGDPRIRRALQQINSGQ